MRGSQEIFPETSLPFLVSANSEESKYINPCFNWLIVWPFSNETVATSTFLNSPLLSTKYIFESAVNLTNAPRSGASNVSGKGCGKGGGGGGVGVGGGGGGGQSRVQVI